MNETSLDIRDRLRAILSDLPERDQAKAAFEMFDVAREKLTEDIRASYPGIPGYEVRVKVFERTCGTEFAPPDRDRISDQIRSSRAARTADWG